MHSSLLMWYTICVESSSIQVILRAHDNDNETPVKIRAMLNTQCHSQSSAQSSECEKTTLRLGRRNQEGSVGKSSSETPFNCRRSFEEFVSICGTTEKGISQAPPASSLTLPLILSYLGVKATKNVTHAQAMAMANGTRRPSI